MSTSGSNRTSAIIALIQVRYAIRSAAVMNSSRHSSEPQSMHTATDVRFSTRSLLIVMGVVAVSATSLGVFIRSFPKDVRLSLAVYWGVLVLIMIGLAVYHARKRYVAEKQAGRVLFLLQKHSYVFPRTPKIGTVLFGGGLTAFAPAIWIVGSFWIERGKILPLLLNWFTFQGIAFTGIGFTVLWWRHVRLAEQGLVVRSKFVAWENTTRWYWDACSRKVVVIEVKGVGRIAAQVPAESRVAIKSLMDEKLPGREYD